MRSSAGARTSIFGDEASRRNVLDRAQATGDRPDSDRRRDRQRASRSEPSPIDDRRSTSLLLGEAPMRRSLARARARPRFRRRMREVDIDEHLGARLTRRLRVHRRRRAARSRSATTSATASPCVLVLAYYRCPMLCGLVLRGAGRRPSASCRWRSARLPRVTVSLDPRDTPADAAHKQQTTLLGATAARRRRELAVPRRRARPQIRALADALGFRYACDRAHRAVRAPGRGLRAHARRPDRALPLRRRAFAARLCASRCSRRRGQDRHASSIACSSPASATTRRRAATARSSAGSCASAAS